MIDMILDGYKLQQLIGTGGMARVFRAEHTETGQVVAIKTLPEEFYNDVTYQLRFKREVEAVSRLNHPNIAPILSYGETDNVSFMVMPFFANGTLGDKLRQHIEFSEQECLRLMEQLCSAIDHAHEQQIVHRDIKPANIMFDEQDNVQLVDFGVAKLVEDTAVDITGSAVVGTWHYMSPEQCMGEKPLTPRTDIYALGIVLHEMLVGRAPFHEATPSQIIQRHMSATISLADDLADQLKPELKFVILKALARKPSQRHKSAMAMVRAFQRAMAT